MSLARWFRVGSRECAHPFLKGGGGGGKTYLLSVELLTEIIRLSWWFFRRHGELQHMVHNSDGM